MWSYYLEAIVKGQIWIWPLTIKLYSWRKRYSKNSENRIFHSGMRLSLSPHSAMSGITVLPSHSTMNSYEEWNNEAKKIAEIGWKSWEVSLWVRTVRNRRIHAIDKYSRTRLFRSHWDLWFLIVILKVCYIEIKYHYITLFGTQEFDCYIESPLYRYIEVALYLFPMSSGFSERASERTNQRSRERAERSN